MSAELVSEAFKPKAKPIIFKISNLDFVSIFNFLITFFVYQTSCRQSLLQTCRNQSCNLPNELRIAN